MIKRVFLACCVLTAIASASFAQNEAASKNLPNFHQINGSLYRGGQPTKDGFGELKAMGIKTIIDLRDNDSNALKEKAMAESAGLRFVNVSLSSWGRPSVAEIEGIVDMLNLAVNQPVFVHCKRGSDRTGTVIAVYRIKHDGWNADQAMDEAKKYGIGWWELGMRDFIRDYYRDHSAKR